MSQFNFQKVIDNIAQVKKELPVLLANDAQKYFLDAFQKQGWNGNSWDEVKRRQEGTPEYKYPSKKGLSRRTKPILIGTGRLRREVSLLAGNARITYEAFNFKVQLTLNSNNVPYALIQNEGGTINKAAGTGVVHFDKSGKFSNKKKANYAQKVNIGAHDITIKQRKFMGDSPELRKILFNRINRYMDKVWKTN